MKGENYLYYCDTTDEPNNADEAMVIPAYTVLGIWEEFIGDTIKVYCGYKNNCQITYTDSLEVIIE